MRFPKRLVFATALIVCFSLSLASCAGRSGVTNPGGETPKAKTPAEYKLEMLRPVAYSSISGLDPEPGSYITVIGRYSGDSYWKEIESGAKQAVSDLNSMLGYTGDDKIRVTFIAPDDKDNVNEQVNILDEELDRYPIAIAIAPIDASACKVQFDSAAENGIPIVTFDSKSEYQRIASHVSTDNTAAAKAVAGELAKAIGNKGEVAIFSGSSASWNERDRVQGFLDTIRESYPEINVVETYAIDQLDAMRQTIAAEWNAAPENTGADSGDVKDAADVEGNGAGSARDGDAGSQNIPDDKPLLPEEISDEDVVSYILNKHPDLAGIYATSADAAEPVAGALGKAETNNIKFASFDGGKDQLKFLEDGIIDGLVLQNPYGMGYAAVIASVRISLKLENESFVDCGYVWVTKENMKEKKIKALLY